MFFVLPDLPRLLEKGDKFKPQIMEKTLERRWRYDMTLVASTNEQCQSQTICDGSINKRKHRVRNETAFASFQTIFSVPFAHPFSVR